MMTQTRDLVFRPVTAFDLAQLSHWRTQPHVRAWWGDGEQIDEEALKHPLVRRWLASVNARPLGYIQDYAVQGWDFDHHFAELAPGSRGIDQYIGEPSLLGRGHGVAMIRQHMARLFQEGVPEIGTDPDPENHHAITVYKAAGFAVFSDPINSKWGRILPMKARPG